MRSDADIRERLRGLEKDVEAVNLKLKYALRIAYEVRRRVGALEARAVKLMTALGLFLASFASHSTGSDTVVSLLTAVQKALGK